VEIYEIGVARLLNNRFVESAVIGSLPKHLSIFVLRSHDPVRQAAGQSRL